MIATLCLSSASLAQNVPAENVPKVFECNGGVVADEETAIAIAEAILCPVYGREAILGQRPYQVTLKDGKWALDGVAPPGFAGGHFHIVILQSDGRVLQIGYSF